MFAKTKAYEVRFKTDMEFKRSNLGGDNFAGSFSLMRHVLFALHETRGGKYHDNTSCY